MRIALLCLVVSSAAWPRDATADPITIFLDGRQVIAGTLVRNNAGQDIRDEKVLPGNGSAAAQAVSPEGYAASAVASLVSSVSDPHHMSGSGAGRVSATVPLTNQAGFSSTTSLPQFNIGFLLGTAHAFDFTAQFTGTNSENTVQVFSSRSWQASLFFIAPDLHLFRVFEDARTLSAGTDQIAREGLLQPGRYQLFIEQILGQDIHRPGATIGLEGRFDFTFDLTPSTVPEPASMILLGSGLIGLLGLRHRRN